MAENERDAVAVFNHLIEVCRDGQKMFAIAADRLGDHNLKALFLRYARQREEFTRELNRLVAALGGKPETSGTAGQAVHRGWMAVKQALGAEDVATIVADVEEEEDVAKAAYQRALAEELPFEARGTVERQYALILEAHDTVRRLEIQTSS